MAKTEMVSVPKEEYEKLKALEELDIELLTKIISSLKNVTEGKFREWTD